MTDIWDEKPKPAIIANGSFPVHDWYDAPKMDAWLEKEKAQIDRERQLALNMEDTVKSLTDEKQALKNTLESVKELVEVSLNQIPMNIEFRRDFYKITGFDVPDWFKDYMDDEE